MRNYLISIVILIAVYFLHVWGMEGAYVRIWWFDILTHGLVCAGIAFWLTSMVRTLFPRLTHKGLLIVTLTFIIGFMWEWLEVQYNITGHPLWSTEFYLDTGGDLVVDTVAAWIVVRFLVGKSAITSPHEQ